MSQNYYLRFQIISHNPLWRTYLRWAYQKCIDDIKNKGYKVDFLRRDFTALLCGTSGEITSLEFVNFVFSKNPEAKIIILDISSIQLEKSKNILSKKFPKAKIKYIQSDANDTSIKNQSVDYIETDGLLEYFSKPNLFFLLKEWKRILKKNGIVTFRAFASDSFLGRIVDKIRLFIGKYYLHVKLYAHTFIDTSKVIKKAGFSFVHGGGTFCPTFKRFSLYNK